MKNLLKILVPSFIAISLVSCMATTAPTNYGYSDSYNQGYSNGYIDGYYRSPDGNYYAPNVVYSDYNGNSYRNGNVYRTAKNRNRNNDSGQRTSTQTRQMPTIDTNQNGTRSQNNGMRSQNTIQPGTNNGTRTQQNNTRVQPQGRRSESQNNIRVQPQIQPNNNSQRPNGSR